MTRNTRNSTFRRLLLQAGFTVERTADMPMGSVVVSTHRHIAGMMLRDYRDMMQMGTGATMAEAEANARPCQSVQLREAASKLDGNTCVYIVGHGAGYVATGYAFRLGELVRLADAWSAERKASA